MVSGYKWVARIRSLVAGVLVAVVLGACMATGADSRDWQSQLYADHALVGRIWDRRTGEFIDESALLDRLGQSAYVLLGEKHDNPDHHALQLQVLRQLATWRHLTAISFEMLDAPAQANLDGLAANSFASADELASYLAWDHDGWDWTFYGPLLWYVYTEGLPAKAGNISRDTMSEVYAGSLSDSVAAVIAGAGYRQLEADIDESHCGMLPASQFPAMVRVQQARDAALAASMPAPAAEGIGVLIAGNYHVRQDLGVPNYLLAAHEGLERDRVIALSFQEVHPELSAPADYQETTADIAAYDFIWFTPAVSDEDYCAGMSAASN